MECSSSRVELLPNNQVFSLRVNRAKGVSDVLPGNAEGKGEGEDHWTVPVEARVSPRLMDTIG